MNKWDERFLELAQVVSSWSKDPSTKVGAVIADKKHIVSVGFNGFPPHVEDRDEWLNERETKYKLIIHAEINAILNSNRSVAGCTLYTYPLFPCPDCSKHLSASGITRVVSRVASLEAAERWGLHQTKFILGRMGIEYEFTE